MKRKNGKREKRNKEKKENDGIGRGNMLMKGRSKEEKRRIKRGCGEGKERGGEKGRRRREENERRRRIRM